MGTFYGFDVHILLLERTNFDSKSLLNEMKNDTILKYLGVVNDGDFLWFWCAYIAPGTNKFWFKKSSKRNEKRYNPQIFTRSKWWDFLWFSCAYIAPETRTCWFKNYSNKLKNYPIFGYLRVVNDVDFLCFSCAYIASETNKFWFKKSSKRNEKRYNPQIFTRSKWWGLFMLLMCIYCPWNEQTLIQKVF